MKNAYTIARGARHFAQLVREVERGGVAAVTRHDKTVAYVVSAARMESLIETRELLANPVFMRVLKADRAGKLKYTPFDPTED